MPFSDRRLKIIGSCNGIVYLKTSTYNNMYLKEKNYFLWNPFINGSYFELPPVPDEFKNADITAQGLGFDRVNDDYKVVRWFGGLRAPSHELCVYSLKQRSWRVIRVSIPFEVPEIFVFFSPDFLEKDCIMANGCAHWLGNCSFIVAFDLETYEYRKLSCDFIKGMSKLTCLNGCLSLVVYDDFMFKDVWVMETYGDETSWRKIASINNRRVVCSSSIMPAAVLEKGRKLLLKDEYQSRYHGFVSYDIGTKCVCESAIVDELADLWYYTNATYRVCVCVASFVNPASYSV